MILILEGVNGAGKTSVCQILRRQGWKVFRAFRDDTSSALLARNGLPINSWQEDVFFADTLRQLNPCGNVVLDRSLLSAVVYQTHGELCEVPDAVQRWWSVIMDQLGARLCWLDLPSAVARERVLKRGGAARELCPALHERYNEQFDRCVLTKQRFDANQHLDALVEEILDFAFN